ncbi:hypothetical protein B0H16DRAFT_1460130 [Mycena metata]|uniref:Uncharacterized protein n=1 Tax=Mycena metata TaxID=1033252 RepID=A0AAD7IY40_9AGAR|nr:hypothetical protein B0H16DRAFT_1460130 [Mycena metata]
MPGGRPRLDPDTKQEHCIAARTRYEDKNVEKRREKARLQMQHKRATIAASDYHTQRKYRDQAAAASERYRDRKAADERAESARRLKSKKLARKKEADALRQAALKLAAELVKTKPQDISSPKNSARKTSRRSSATDTFNAPTRIIVPSSLAARSYRANAASVTWTIAQVVLAYAWSPWTGLSMRAGTSTLPARHAASTIARVVLSLSRFRRSLSPTRLVVGLTAVFAWGFGCRAFRALYTQFLVFSMFLSNSPPSYGAAPWPSTPRYMPAAGFENMNLEGYAGTFYAVLTDDWQGFAISKLKMQRSIFASLKTRFLRATTWSAEGWSSFKTKWYSTPPSSPSSTVLSVSRSPSPSECSISRSPSPPSSTPHSNSPSPSPSTTESFTSPASPPRITDVLTREELAELAAFRPGPGPISPRRLQQQFVRVLGPEAATPPNYNNEDDGDVPPRKPSRRMRHGVEQPEPVQTYHDAAHSPPCQAHVHAFYAVSGLNCVFRNRERAIAAWRATPDADFFFNDDEDAVWEFLRGG